MDNKDTGGRIYLTPETVIEYVHKGYRVVELVRETPNNPSLKEAGAVSPSEKITRVEVMQGQVVYTFLVKFFFEGPQELTWNILGVADENDIPQPIEHYKPMFDDFMNKEGKVGTESDQRYNDRAYKFLWSTIQSDEEDEGGEFQHEVIGQPVLEALIRKCAKEVLRQAKK